MPTGGLASQFFASTLTLTGQAITSLDVLQEKSISEIDYRQRCVSIFSDKMDMACDHEYEHDDHDNTTLHYTPTTTRPHNKGWRSATDATLRGHREHPCGVPAMTPAAHRGPFAGRPCVARQPPRDVTRHDHNDTTERDTHSR